MSGNTVKSPRLFRNMAGTSEPLATSYLKKIIGSPVGKVFSLISDEMIIGRNRQSAQICVNDPNISRCHCVLKYKEKGWFIKDLESANGTFLDGKWLEPKILYPLKDGAGIYLGPPNDAPVAFIFLTKQPNEKPRSCKPNMKSRGQKNEGNTHVPVLVSNKNNKSIKRPSDSKASNTNECLLQKKIKTISPSSSSAVQNSDSSSDPHDDDDEVISDCSITSSDSLRTRVKKLSAQKVKSIKTRNDTTIAASTSASLKLKPSSNETIKGESSQSLLNDSKNAIDSFFQPFPEIAVQKEIDENKNNVKFVKEDLLEEQLRKATSKLEKLQRDKLHLCRLVEDLKSEEIFKKKLQVEFQKLLEDELMCNICTEVFIKAVTLGCSHTFCEYCITEWKKKQKKCPICREKITSETKILIFDSFINKVVENLDAETQNKRKELIANREKKNAKKQKKKKKRPEGNPVQSDSSEDDQIRQLHGEASNGIGLHIRILRRVPSIQLLQEDNLIEMANDRSHPSDGSDISVEGIDHHIIRISDPLDGSDISVEGNGYFGGYGRCHNCGRRGHWANGCPF